MALYQVNSGDRILAADLNQFYNILKGVAASGESVTLIYNAAGVLVAQPSSDPAAGTQLIQIKNNAGTVKAALTNDGGAVWSARVHLAKGADVASANALTPGVDGNYFHVTGTTAITSIATAQAGSLLVLEFDGILTLTHNASSLILRNGANVTTAAGDVFTFRSEGSGNWREVGRLTAASAAGGQGGTPAPVYAVANAAGVATTFLRTDDTLKDPQFNPALYTAQLRKDSIVGTVSLVGGTGNAGIGALKFLGTGANANSFLRDISCLDNGLTNGFNKTKFFRSHLYVESTATTQTVFAGIAGIATAAAYTATEKHIGFKFDPAVSANWYATAASGTTETTLDTGVAAATSTIIVLSFTYDGTTATFYVNGVSKGTIITNLPTGTGTNGIYLTHYIDNKAVANTRNMDVAEAIAMVSVV